MNMRKDPLTRAPTNKSFRELEKARDLRIKKSREWREKRGLSVMNIAEAVGVEYPTVFRWFAYGVVPIHLHRKAVKDVFFDCPIAR